MTWTCQLLSSTGHSHQSSYFVNLWTSMVSTSDLLSSGWTLRTSLSCVLLPLQMAEGLSWPQGSCATSKSWIYQMLQRRPWHTSSRVSWTGSCSKSNSRTTSGSRLRWLSLPRSSYMLTLQSHCFPFRLSSTTPLTCETWLKCSKEFWWATRTRLFRATTLEGSGCTNALGSLLTGSAPRRISRNSKSRYASFWP